MSEMFFFDSISGLTNIKVQGGRYAFVARSKAWGGPVRLCNPGDDTNTVKDVNQHPVMLDGDGAYVVDLPAGTFQIAAPPSLADLTVILAKVN